MSVDRKIAGDRFIGRFAVIVLILLFFQVLMHGCSSRPRETEAEQDTLKSAMLGELGDTVKRTLYSVYMPSLSFSLESDHETYWLLQEQIDSVLPFYGYLMDGLEGEGISADTLHEILLAESREGSEYSREEVQQDSFAAPDNGLQGESPEGAGSTLEELLRAENEAAMRNQFQIFVPHTRQAQIDLAALQNYETLIKEFYTVDSNTMAGSDQLDINKLLSKDMTISPSGEGPQILIYHTHSQEGFADSVAGDDNTNIQAVGEHLAQILRDTYGYQVLHHTGEYDINGRDGAYTNALPEIEKILAQNPSIQVVIDLHRDEIPETTRLVMDLDGRPTARFMFFNGLSRTRTTGNIAYLYNEHLDDNLAFSFQMQMKAAEYYPGLTRKIYLKGYRYNMHLASRYLLIELGAQNNILEEAMNACDPLAHILDMVLSGE